MSKAVKRKSFILNRGHERLDNAGKLYPSVSTQKWSALFRVAAVMKNDVNPELLQQAVDAVLPRFPTFSAQLVAGFFWYYLRANPKRLLIEPDIDFPCSPIPWREKNAHLLKIYYGKRRIAIDFFHAVTDGAGAFVFVKTLVAEYLRLTGIIVPAELGVLDLKSEVPLDEISDAFRKLELPKSNGLINYGRAYRFPVRKDKVSATHIHTYLISIPEIKAVANTFSATINEFLAAAFLYIGINEQIKDNPRKLRPVRLSVPVNMRRYYETNTLRNFAIFVAPEIKPPFTGITFEKIIVYIRDFMKEALTKENLYAITAPNVALEKNFFSKITPLFLKNFLIQFVYKIMSSKSTTTTLTNLGVFTAPTPLMNELETIEVMLGPARKSGIGATILTTKDVMRIAFTGTQVHPQLPENLERFFNSLGIATVKEVITEWPKTKTRDKQL